jgi:hypothetical protein
MAKGPSNDFSTIDPFARLDMSFRIINDYFIMYDRMLTRFDVKIGNEQFNVVFASGQPIEPQDGSKILPQDDLLTPKNVVACLNLKVSKQEFIKALKELITDMEKS